MPGSCWAHEPGLQGGYVNIDVSERAFEDAIEASLLRHSEGVIAEEQASYLDMPSGGYQKRRDEDYDRALCLIPQDVVGLCSGNAAPRVETAFTASRGGCRGAVPEADVLRNPAQGHPRRAAQRSPRHGQPLPPRLLPTLERAERGDPVALQGQYLRRSRGSCITARETTRAST